MGKSPSRIKVAVESPSHRLSLLLSRLAPAVASSPLSSSSCCPAAPKPARHWLATAELERKQPQLPTPIKNHGERWECNLKRQIEEAKESSLALGVKMAKLDYRCLWCWA
ncbi:hypothetical protein AAHA92_15121 [Salvia divinorum]|uniref:Uncharacterized protein n=1 Tax=Salvia divinorum TaxID=28513 RepID=A0ABD1HHQ7_SALDI